MHEVKLTSKYRFTIPKSIRLQLGIKPGDAIKFEHDEFVINCILIRKKRLPKK